MKRKSFVIAAAAFLMSALACAPAYAATAITSVAFTFGIESDASIEEGYNEPQITVAKSASYEVDDFSCASDTSSISGKTALTYTLTLEAKRNYYFPTASTITVAGTNITEVTKKTTSSGDNQILTIRFKAYPYYQLAAPKFETEFAAIKGSKSKTDTEGRGTVVNISKNGASKIEYLISYVDTDGEYKTKSGTTTSSSISVGSYNKRYTGTSSYKNSAYIRGIAMRAAGNSSSNANVAPSDWVYMAGGLTKMDTDEYFTDYTTWDDFTSDTGETINNQGTSNSAYGYSSQVSTFGWSGSGDTWYYYYNGNKVTGWIHDGSNWYYCDTATGKMKAGWFQDTDGRWYYLNANHDGTYGKMVTGWIKQGNTYYYLNPKTGGPMGSMVTGTMVIDGKTYNFNSSGALIG